MKILLVAILALFLAGTAVAENISIDAPPTTPTSGVPDMFLYIEGDHSLQAIYAAAAGNTTLANSVSIAPTGIPGWLHIVIPEEATLTVGRIVFKERSDSPDFTTAATFAWGDTVEIYIGEAKFDDWFKVTGWDEAVLYLEGSAAGNVDVYWSAEKYSDSE